MTAHSCDHHTDGHGLCRAPTTKRYLTGWRCPDHTPARQAGRPERSELIGTDPTRKA